MRLRLPIGAVLPATPRARILRLDLLHQPFFYRAGHAAYLRAPDSPQYRPYSIASAPEETARDGWLEFLVQVDASGEGSIPLNRLTVGALIDVDGPVGSFEFPEHPAEPQLLFIAGGTGIAPLRSMLWHALLAEGARRVSVVYSARAPEEFAYLEELERLAAEGRIAFRQTVTRTSGPEWTGGLGRIDAACLAPLIEPGATLSFVCGPPALLAEMRPLLQQLGVRPDQIRMEEWNAGDS